MIAVAVVVIVASALVVFLRSGDEPADDHSYATAETLSADGAGQLWNRWSDARESCDVDAMRQVATAAFISSWKSDEGGADTEAQACANAAAHEQFKSTTELEVSGDPSFVSEPPALTITYRVTQSDLLGGNRSTHFAHLVVSYERGGDGTWRVESARWRDGM